MDVEHITAYMDYLKQDCGLAVSLHLLDCAGHTLVEKMLPYNLHENPYCLYLKLAPAMWRACIERQRRVLTACKNGAFCGTCHAGVRELVYPVTTKGETVGFVSVSGYQDPKAASYHARLAEKYGFSQTAMAAIYQRLSAEMPERRLIDTLIYPLCAMLTLVLDAEEIGEEPIFSVRLMHYLRLNHNRRLTMEEICEEFHCSASYVGHRFKEQTGMTVHCYLRRLRIENAARLLRASNLHITEIAIATGFESSNYFSHVFRAETGMSPKAYRLQEKARAKGTADRV